MTGQINLKHKAGQFIYEFCQKNEINDIVEIGTWNGLGSTYCIHEAIKNTNKRCISLETDPVMHATALKNNHDKKEITILNGKITDDVIDLHSLNQNFFTDYPLETKLNWLKSDMINLKSCPNVLHKIPEKIDFLILDGGEFSSYYEYLILKNRCKFIFCDDTLSPCIKNYEVRLDLIKNHKILLDDQNERHGFCAAEMLTN